LDGDRFFYCLLEFSARFVDGGAVQVNFALNWKLAFF